MDAHRNEDVEIRASREQDREGILGLAEHVFGTQPAQTMRREWQWQWHEDPRLQRPGHVGVVAECRGEIVASTALQPAGMVWDGEPVSAWWSVNTMVHSRHRRQGIAERMFTSMLSERENDIVLGKGISAPALPMLQKCGFTLADTGGYWRRTLNLAPSLARLVGPWLAKPLALVPNVIRCRLPAKPDAVVAVDATSASAFDARFDELWSSIVNKFECITRRDAAVLDWRYRRHPLQRFRVLQCFDGPRLRGYIVFRIHERRRIRRARICDLLAADDSADVRQRLLLGAMHAAREAGADRIDCFAGAQSLRQSLRQLAFTPAAGPEPLAMRGVSCKSPYVMAGDGDGG